MDVVEHSSFGGYMYPISVGYTPTNGITGSRHVFRFSIRCQKLSKGPCPLTLQPAVPKARLSFHWFGRTQLHFSSAQGQLCHEILMAFFINSNTNGKNNNSKGNLLHT